MRASERLERDARAGGGSDAADLGRADPYWGSSLTHGLEEWVPEIRVERIPDSSHWVQNDVPGRVNELLVRFFQ